MKNRIARLMFAFFQVYLTVLKHGDSSTLDTMLKVRLQSAKVTLLEQLDIFLWLSAIQLHKQADMQEEKNRVERVLGAISAPDLIQKVLNFALSVCTNPFFGVITDM